MCVCVYLHLLIVVVTLGVCGSFAVGFPFFVAGLGRTHVCAFRFVCVLSFRCAFFAFLVDFIVQCLCLMCFLH